jgi:dolichol kinase
MSELSALVARTEGPQPWRRVFHALTAVVIVGALTRFEPYDRTPVLLLVAVSATLLALDLGRLAYRPANELFFRLFNRLASPREIRRVASSTWYAFGALVTIALFERPAAISGILVLGFCDPAAAYIGRRWGKRPWLGGTAEGSLVFLIGCLTIVGVRHGWWVAIPTGVVVTLLERKSWPLDDNLTMPVACAASIAGMGLIP